MVAPWYIWVETHFNGSFHCLVGAEWGKHLVGRYPNGQWYDDVPRLIFLAMHLGWWFPWSFAILPPLFAWRRVMRPREISFEDALPMSWGLVVLSAAAIIGQRQDYYALSMFSAFALSAAMIFDRAPRSLQSCSARSVSRLPQLPFSYLSSSRKINRPGAKPAFVGRRCLPCEISRRARGCNSDRSLRSPLPA